MEEGGAQGRALSALGGQSHRGGVGKTRRHAEQSEEVQGALGTRLWGPKFCPDLHRALHTLPRSRDPAGPGPKGTATATITTQQPRR